MARTANDRPVLVTGANGFIGRHLVDALLARGERVRALVRSEEKGRDLPEDVEIHVGDVTRPMTLPDAVAGVRAVYHVAGTVKGRRAETFRRVNEHGTRSLVLACRKSAPDLDRFLLVSSLAATGPVRRGSGRPVAEEDEPRPVSEYGRSKRAGEVAAFDAAGGLPVTVVRPPVVYGPRDTGVLTFFRIADRGFRPRFTREKYYSIIHVDDLVRGMIAAAESSVAAGRIYHLANRSAPSFTRLFEIIATHTGKPLRPLPLPTALLPLIAGVVDTLSGTFGMNARPLSDKVREIMQDLWVMDTTRAKTDFGFQAEVSLAAGFAETAASYRELGWLPSGPSCVT